MSKDNKLFKCAGVSLGKTGYKVRFASDMTRVKVLMKTGNSDIELLELPHAMTKDAAVAHLKTTSLMDRAEYRQAIENADVKYDTKSGASATVKVAAPKVAKVKRAKSAPSIEEIRARAKVQETPAQELVAIFANMVNDSKKELAQG